MKATRVQIAKQWTRNNTLLTFVLVFGVIGSLMLFVSHAATPTTSIELENGFVSGTASIVNDGSASNGKAVKFGSNPCQGVQISPGPNTIQVAIAANGTT